MQQLEASNGCDGGGIADATRGMLVPVDGHTAIQRIIGRPDRRTKRVIIDPDRFLATPDGHLWSPERSRAAWTMAFDTLDAALAAAPSPAEVIVVCGVQGAGKSTWARKAAQDRPLAILFDAALPGRRHRQPIIAAAHRSGAQVSAVWIDTPLALALRRNLMRSSDRIVPEAALRAVAERFEPPSQDEGFATVLRVRS